MYSRPSYRGSGVILHANVSIVKKKLVSEYGGDCEIVKIELFLPYKFPWNKRGFTYVLFQYLNAHEIDSEIPK